MLLLLDIVLVDRPVDNQSAGSHLTVGVDAAGTAFMDYDHYIVTWWGMWKSQYTDPYVPFYDGYLCGKYGQARQG